ncbi:hypothetical protein [Ralstonia phage RSP15]|uniref:hypothetical protein n=1 Tax=Ralstonia phage RSP15 TaxID=1785960 RepID=UPI00074D40A8|nr:hypothetical protein BH754_gp241 [Ralstonia phage RSP15]BAU40065.1 hypothetical protein [Ralstonia phage RSP15]
MSTVQIRTLEYAKAFIQENLKECCEELISLQKTGILEQGKVRELHRKLYPLGDSHIVYPLAEKLVQDAALRFVIENTLRV